MENVILAVILVIAYWYAAIICFGASCFGENKNKSLRKQVLSGFGFWGIGALGVVFYALYFSFASSVKEGVITLGVMAVLSVLTFLLFHKGSRNSAEAKIES